MRCFLIVGRARDSLNTEIRKNSQRMTKFTKCDNPDLDLCILIAANVVYLARLGLVNNMYLLSKLLFKYTIPNLNAYAHRFAICHHLVNQSFDLPNCPCSMPLQSHFIH